jgi:hypothetical protein
MASPDLKPPPKGDLVTYSRRARPRVPKDQLGPRKVREVYFVRARTLGLIKIGVSDFAAERISKLGLSSPDHLDLLGVVLCPNGGQLEGDLHCRFAAQRSHGEWYFPSEALLDYIRDNAHAPRARAAAPPAPNEWDDLVS